MLSARDMAELLATARLKKGGRVTLADAKATTMTLVLVANLLTYAALLFHGQTYAARVNVSGENGFNVGQINGETKATSVTIRCSRRSAKCCARMAVSRSPRGHVVVDVVCHGEAMHAHEPPPPARLQARWDAILELTGEDVPKELRKHVEKSECVFWPAAWAKRKAAEEEEATVEPAPQKRFMEDTLMLFIEAFNERVVTAPGTRANAEKLWAFNAKLEGMIAR